MAKIRVLFVVNKKIPEGDYRLAYGEISRVSVVSYAMPAKPSGLPVSRFVQMKVGEGFNLGQPFHLIAHCIYLFLHRSGYDLIHYYSTWLILFGPIIAFVARVPSMITVTGFGRTFTSANGWYKFLRPIYWILLNLSLRLTKVVLFQNHADMKHVSGLFPKFQSKIKYIGSAVSVPLVLEKNYHTPELIILSVMRLLPDKGIVDLLQIASALGSNRITFNLVGPRSVGFDALYQQVIQSDKSGKINYIGELEHQKLLSEYKKAHIFLFPSYAEGMPRVMLEAGYALLCPIAYDIPANRELVSEERGYLVPLKDVQQVIDVISRLEREPDCVMRLARNYQRWVVENFNIEEFVKRMDHLVIEAIS